jgi:hypothetical protein
MRDWKFFVTDDSLESSLVNVKYRGLRLPSSVIDKIYYQNARKWLKAFQEEKLQ